MVDISVILPTARQDYPILEEPDLHMLEITINSLMKQTFSNFEVIVIDALHDTREFPFDKVNFPVKHIPSHPNHRFWLDRKRWNVCGALNTGLLHAEGELIARIDDCSEFENTFLENIWEAYQTGLWLQAMHIRFLGGKPARLNAEYREKGYEVKYSKMFEPQNRVDVLRNMYGEDGIIRDTRYPKVVDAGGKMIAHYEWMYGYSTFTLEAALKINGFDELFDGDKSQEDQDFGSRLDMAGYKNLFLLDVNHQVIEHEHEPIPEAIIEKDAPNIKCNYAIYLLNRRKNQWKANTIKLTEEDITFIIEESLRPPCSPRPNFYVDDCQGDLFKLWASNQPKFDLREERLSI